VFSPGLLLYQLALFTGKTLKYNSEFETRKQIPTLLLTSGLGRAVPIGRKRDSELELHPERRRKKNQKLRFKICSSVRIQKINY